MNNYTKKILLVGSGYMANEYLNVLASLKYEVIIVGRGQEKINSLKSKFPLFEYHFGGLNNFLNNYSNPPLFAINTVNIDQLKDTTCKLIEKGIKYLLVEKPGDIYLEGLKEMEYAALINDSKVFIAYNRRFYSSVLNLQKEALKDGGVISAHFEFTEWAHTIDPAVYHPESLKKWILCNSSHVIDTVFSIIGLPKHLHATIHGQDEIDWHPSGSIFTGSGISIKNIPFTYHSNWSGPGRWGIEIITKKRRFYLKPMEKLQVQNKGSVQINEFAIDDRLDLEFKPGLFLQTTSFLQPHFDNFVSLKEQIEVTPFYDKIGGY